MRIYFVNKIKQLVQRVNAYLNQKRAEQLEAARIAKIEAEWVSNTCCILRRNATGEPSGVIVFSDANEVVAIESPPTAPTK